MLDIKFIQENADLVKRGAELKKFKCDIDRLCSLDDRRREIQQKLDQLRHESKSLGAEMAQARNPKSKQYKDAIAAGATPEQLATKADELHARLTGLREQTKALEQESKDVLPEFEKLMLTVPQPPSDDVPVGADDTENVEIRRVGDLPRFDFQIKDHVALATELGMLDIERGVKLAGTRNYVLKGYGVQLHHAVLRLALDMMVQRGFEALHVPVLVRDEMMYGTGYFPGGEEQAYRCERDDLSLVGTAEVSLTAYHCEEILDEADLPRKYCAVSPCFRREAGAAGKDTYGLYRIHIFDKVEQVIVCANDQAASIAFHNEILANAETVMAKLEMPYRVVNVCTGDLGQGQVQKFDIETWMPSRNSYSETHSASRFYEFQARRLNLRYRDSDRKVRYCHTLNNTVIASPRILIPLIEIHQQADGGIAIPEALRPYMGGLERIEPKTT